MPGVKERAWVRDTHFGVVTVCVCIIFKATRLNEITKIMSIKRRDQGTVIY